MLFGRVADFDFLFESLKVKNNLKLTIEIDEKKKQYKVNFVQLTSNFLEKWNEIYWNLILKHYPYHAATLGFFLFLILLFLFFKIHFRCVVF